MPMFLAEMGIRPIMIILSNGPPWIPSPQLFSLHVTGDAGFPLERIDVWKWLSLEIVMTSAVGPTYLSRY